MLHPVMAESPYRGAVAGVCAVLLALIASVDAVTITPRPLSERSLAELLTLDSAITAAREFWVIFGPGGKLHPATFLEHRGHLVIEGLLLATVVWFFLQARFKPNPRAEAALNDKEVDDLCREWEPEPLVPTMQAAQRFPDPPIVTSANGIYVTVNGKRALNLGSANFLNLAGDKTIMAHAEATIKKYGVGSCGPRGFYGTIDVHLALEEELASFYGTPEAIMYSYDIATVASIIPAFANRRDNLVVDEHCAYAIQQGCDLSRARLHYFKHNDMADLERILSKIDGEERKAKKPVTRRLIIVEGIYANYGDVAPLDQIMKLKEKYKYRLCVDESSALGVLGATGRGACEHFNIPPREVEIICGSLGNALGSVGGFCVGEHEVVEHQRLSGLGYCFSASLPPYLSTAASLSLARLREQGSSTLLPALACVVAALRTELCKVPGLVLVGSTVTDALSPVLHLHLATPEADPARGDALLQAVADRVLDSGTLLSVSRYSFLDRTRPPPSLRVYANVALTDKDIASVTGAIRKAAKDVLHL